MSSGAWFFMLTAWIIIFGAVIITLKSILKYSKE